MVFLLPLDDGSSRLSRTLKEEVVLSPAELTVLCPFSDESEVAVLRVGDIDLERLCLVAPVKKSRVVFLGDALICLQHRCLIGSLNYY